MLVEPYKSVGELSFGDNRAKIRSLLGPEFESGVKEFGEIKDYYDYFKSIGLYVYYNADDYATAFEFFEPTPLLHGLDLLQTPYRTLLERFKSIDAETDEDYNGFTSYKYGIAITTNDDPESGEAMPYSAMVFERGYYD